MEPGEPRGVRWGLVLKGIVPVLALALVAGGLLILPDWLLTFPRPFRRQCTEWFLRALVAGYWGVVAAALPGTVLLAWLVLRARKRRVRRPRLARWLLLCVATLLSLILMETGAAVWGAWVHRMPALPGRLPASPSGEVHLAVIGESSARGDPFHPWLSIGQIVGWKLEQAVPGRKVVVDVLAEPGITLERMHHKLEGLDRRPDALIIYCGHNEFQARFDWGRNVGFDEAPFNPVLNRLFALSLHSPLCRMIFETISKHRLDAPPLMTRHELIDPPLCSPSEAVEVLADFRRRLEAIVAFCDRAGTLPILVIPPGNDGGFEPNRSALPGSVSPSSRRAFRSAFAAARAAEGDPPRAIALYRTLLALYPGFAETHFRLGRLYAAQGDRAEANRQYARARDCDAFPQRCPSPFQDVYRAVAARHHCPLIDGPAELRAVSPGGILDDNLFHDAQHPALAGHIALARAVLRALRARQALGWRGAEVPVIDPAECARHFGVGAKEWSTVCSRAAWFYGVTAKSRYDPSDRLAKQRRFEEASRRVAGGLPPEASGIPGLGVHPAPVADPDWAGRPEETAGAGETRR